MHPLYPKVYFQKDEAQVEPATAFVLMPFKREFLGIFDEIREALSQLSPAVRVVRGDDLNIGGSIIADILAGIARADFIIADLTGHNPNVFYELGICHVVKDDVILLSQRLEDLPFDLRHLRCILYEDSPSGLRALSSKLRAAVRELLDGRKRKSEAEALRRIAHFGALRVGDWISAWTNVLKAMAEWPEFRGNDVACHESALGKAAAVLGEFSGGVYSLDAEGTVLSSFPLDIRGQNYAHREYFRLCSTRRTSVVSNSFDSANRDHPIVVIAVPRFDVNGTYLGILDTVMDVDSSPLDRILRPIALDPFAGPDVQVMLVDQKCVVVGASDPGLAGKNVGGNPWIHRIFQVEPSEQGIFLDEQKTVAAFPVSNTPFRLVAVNGQLMR